MDLVEFLRARAVESDDFARVARLPAKHRARYQREAESLRGILELHKLGSWHSHVLDADVVTCETCSTADEDWPCPTLRLLALPYADHPDFREEWRP